jgi:hypothetical protein
MFFSRGYRVFLLCCCGLGFLFGALVFKNCFNDVRKYWNSSSWPKKEARVTSTLVSEYDNPQAERTEFERDNAFGQRNRRVTRNPGEPDTYFVITIRYQYDVNGQLYRGEVRDALHRTRAAAERAASKTYSQGAIIEMAYDPMRPENHWAYGQDPSPLGVATGGMVMGAVFMLPLLAYVGYKLHGALQKQS